MQIEELRVWHEVHCLRPDHASIQKKITSVEIKDVLLKKHLHLPLVRPFPPNSHTLSERELVVTARGGVVLFIVAGSPHIGHALYITTTHNLYFYNSTGERFLELKEVFVVDL